MIFDKVSVSYKMRIKKFSAVIAVLIFILGIFTNNINAQDSESSVLWEKEAHGFFVASLDFSPDGKILASGGDGEELKLWEASSGKLIRSIKTRNNFVFAITFSPDGRTVASSGGDMEIKLWRTKTGELIESFKGHLGRVGAVAFNSDGTKLAAGGSDSRILLWEVSTGKSIKTFEAFDSHIGEIITIAISPDETKIAVGSYNKWGNNVNIREVSTGRLIKSLKAHNEYVKTLAFSPDGKTFVTGGSDNTVKLWETSTGNLIKTVETDNKLINLVWFSPDGKTLVTGGDDTIQLWEIQSGHLTQATPDGGDTTLFWETLIGHPFATIKTPKEMLTLAFSPDGKNIASGIYGGSVRIWNNEKFSLSSAEETAINKNLLIFIAIGGIFILLTASGIIVILLILRNQKTKKTSIKEKPAMEKEKTEIDNLKVTGSEKTKPKKLQKVLFMTVFGISSFIASILGIINYVNLLLNNTTGNLAISIIPSAFLISAAIVIAIFIYKIWLSIQDGYARTSPEKAVGFLFIPFYNFYWLFQVWWGFSKDFNKLVNRHSLKISKLPESLFLIYCILIFAGVIPGIGISAGIASTIIMLILISKVCDGVNALPNNYETVGDIEETQEKATKGIPVWIGFILAGVSAIATFIDIYSQSGYRSRQTWWSIIFVLATVFYMCFCIYKQHKALQKLTNGNHPISPAKAVGFHFIPLFNYYWIFKWPYEMGKTIGKNNSGIKMHSSLFGFMLILGTIIGIIPLPIGGKIITIGSVVTGFIVFAVLYYFNNKLNEASKSMGDNMIAPAERYINMEPVATDLEKVSGIKPTKPRYILGENDIGRVSSKINDTRLIPVFGIYSGSGKKFSDYKELAQYVYKGIRHYAHLSAVIKFFFPNSDGTRDSLSLSDLQKLYTGTENLLLEMYNELPEGDVLQTNLLLKKLTAC
jgi:WD40 repeat protein/uncharacterized membrane protein